MGKQKRTNAQKRKQKKQQKQIDSQPFVSICTPTFNRRPFVSSMIKCFDHQDYPKDKMEWIIIDDGTDKIEDLVKDHPNVKYFSYSDKMTLGKKRNLMHEKATGDIIVYMDDDDYYPPQRVSHAVESLTRSNCLVAGSSELYTYFKHIDKVYQFGPYGKDHATAGTFAFKKELLKHTRYNESASLAEEKEFLKNYSFPMVQLDPKKVILVFSHDHNTFDKKILLETPNPTYVKESRYTVDELVKEEDLKAFFMNEIHDLLKSYEPGRPKNKPDVLTQLDELKKKRSDAIARQQQALQDRPSGIVMSNNNGQNRNLTHGEVAELLQKQNRQIVDLESENEDLKRQIQMYKDAIEISKARIEVNDETQEPKQVHYVSHIDSSE